MNKLIINLVLFTLTLTLFFVTSKGQIKTNGLEIKEDANQPIIDSNTELTYNDPLFLLRANYANIYARYFRTKKEIIYESKN